MEYNFIERENNLIESLNKTVLGCKAKEHRFKVNRLLNEYLVFGGVTVNKILNFMSPNTRELKLKKFNNILKDNNKIDISEILQTDNPKKEYYTQKILKEYYTFKKGFSSKIVYKKPNDLNIFDFEKIFNYVWNNREKFKQTKTEKPFYKNVVMSKGFKNLLYDVKTDTVLKSRLRFPKRFLKVINLI